MPDNVNTYSLAELVSPLPESDSPSVIKIENVSMVFNVASQQLNSLKEYAIALAKHELRFKAFHALSNIYMDVRKGDVFGILGTNGSGKSTLLKIVAGVLEPSEGNVTIHGSIAPLIELGAGFDIELTAAENIYLNGALLGYTRKFIDQHFDEIVSFAEVENFLDMPLKNYSSGMVARIAFAIATVIVPDILIVDEVLAVGDAMFQQKCERRIQELIKEHGVTVLIVSHSTDQIERLCNKAIWIEKSHTRAVGKAEEVCRLYRILGGHIGSEQSEQAVLEALQSNVEVTEGLIDTISGDNRFSTAVQFLRGRDKDEHSDTIIIAPGDYSAYCLIANSLSAAFGCVPIFLTKEDALPDITKQAIQHQQFKHAILVGNEAVASSDVFTELESLVGRGNVVRIRGNEPEQCSAAAYHYASEVLGKNAWGRTAFVSFNTCIHDIVSVFPVMFSLRAPLLFGWNKNQISEFHANIIKPDTFDELVFLGGPDLYPDSLLQEYENMGIHTIRFLGKSVYDANRQINQWIDMLASQNLIEISGLALVTAIWDPCDSFACGPFVGSNHAIVIQEEPQDLDSVSAALDYIKSSDSNIENLLFVGGRTKFTDVDKSILAQALAQKDRRLL